MTPVKHRLFSLLWLLALVMLLCCSSRHQAHLSTPTQRLLHEIARQNQSAHPDSLPVLSPASQKTFAVKSSPRGLFVRATLRVGDPAVEADLIRLGVSMHTRIEGIWTADLPLSTLQAVTRLEGLDAIEIDMPVRKRGQ